MVHAWFRRLSSRLALSFALTALAALAIREGAAWLPRSAGAAAFALGTLAVAGGTVFGFWTGRRLARRIERLSAVVDGCVEGAPGPLAAGDDEIAGLGERLARLARQHRELVLARQQLLALQDRNRVARDLHDRVKQQVFAIATGVSTARELVEQGERELARLPLGEAERLASQAQRELTELIHQLRPAVTEDRTLGPALEEWVAGWSRQSAIAADVTVALEAPLPGDAEEALFGVAQAALADVARTGGASAVRVHLAEDGGAVVLEVVDDGPVAETDGQADGMDTLRERIESLGGGLQVSREDGRGTIVTARYLRAPEPAPA